MPEQAKNVLHKERELEREKYERTHASNLLNCVTLCDYLQQGLKRIASTYRRKRPGKKLYTISLHSLLADFKGRCAYMQSVQERMLGCI